MTPSGEDSADPARIQPASVLSQDGTTSASPQISVDSPGLLATARPGPTFILSPVRIPPLVTSPARASSPLLAATDPSSPASRPLSPKKAARRRASKRLALAPAPQLFVDTADTLPTLSSWSYHFCSPGGSPHLSLRDLLQRYGAEIAQVAPGILPHHFKPGEPTSSTSLQALGLQPREPAIQPFAPGRPIPSMLLHISGLQPREPAPLQLPGQEPTLPHACP
ncbi:hypothetical protein C0989_005061 [Termitomyces sp. Mn162]|nr:hypothetical protein C0989_005061 [Termitomyces sp. Mn162]